MTHHADATHSLSPRAPHTRAPRRRGVALPVALMAIVLMAAMVAGASYFAMQNGRQADNTRRVEKSFPVAEAATAEFVRTWTPATYNLKAVGSNTPFSQATSPLGGGTYQGSVTKFTQKTFLLDLTAWDSVNTKARGGGARQRVGTLLRLVPINVDIQSALTTLGPVAFGGGNVFIEGNDALPPTWPSTQCPPLGANLAGIRSQKIGDLPSSQGQFHGAPDSLVSPALDTSALTQFGTTNYVTLAASRNVKITPGMYATGPNPNSATGPCVPGQTNWGDGQTLTNACGNYYPIVYDSGAGTTTISSGQGQGILLVDGNLTISGNWTFWGVVIVKGKLMTSGAASPKIYGAVLAGGIDFTSTSGSGSAVVNYSSCSVSRSLDANGMATPVRSRGFIRMQ